MSSNFIILFSWVESNETFYSGRHLLYSGVWRRVDLQVSCNVSQESAASILRATEDIRSTYLNTGFLAVYVSLALCYLISVEKNYILNLTVAWSYVFCVKVS
jgi:hypothetical protein